MAVDQYLFLEGIPGQSTDDRRTDEIDVLAWAWGASQSGTTHMGTGGGAGKVAVQDLSITKYLDASSHLLWKAVATGKHIPNGQLTVRKAGGDPLEYFIVAMEDILITTLSTGGSGGEDRLTENISLNFARYTVSYSKQKEDGSGEAAKESAYDMTSSKEVGPEVNRIDP